MLQPERGLFRAGLAPAAAHAAVAARRPEPALVPGGVLALHRRGLHHHQDGRRLWPVPGPVGHRRDRRHPAHQLHRLSGGHRLRLRSATALVARRGIYLALAVYIVATLLAVFLHTALEFYALATTIGLVQGGVQSLSRSLYARLIPPEKSGEYFGFFNMLGKFSSMLGPVLAGTAALVTRQPALRYPVDPRPVCFRAGAAHPGAGAARHAQLPDQAREPVHSLCSRHAVVAQVQVARLPARSRAPPGPVARRATAAAYSAGLFTRLRGAGPGPSRRHSVARLPPPDPAVPVCGRRPSQVNSSSTPLTVTAQTSAMSRRDGDSMPSSSSSADCWSGPKASTHRSQVAFSASQLSATRSNHSPVPSRGRVVAARPGSAASRPALDPLRGNGGRGVVANPASVQPDLGPGMGIGLANDPVIGQRDSAPRPGSR